MSLQARRSRMLKPGYRRLPRGRLYSLRHSTNPHLAVHNVLLSRRAWYCSSACNELRIWLDLHREQYLLFVLYCQERRGCSPLRHECKILGWRTDRELYTPCCFGVGQCDVSDIHRDGLRSTICGIGQDKANPEDAEEESKSLHLCTQAHG